MPAAKLSRRHFLRSTALAAPLLVRSSVLGREKKTPPSERISLGIIGVNGMGRTNLDNCARHSDVVVTGVCDVWKKRRDAVTERFKTTAKSYADYRELLARPDIDAVIIATPPHWHALMAIHAAEAGKDIYLQKPMTLHPAETLAVRNAINKHECVCQVGTQIHASANYRRVVEWIRSGQLGPISAVRTFNVMNQGPRGIGRAPKQNTPEGLDWDAWLGPAPARPYNALLAESAYHHCSFWDYSGGWTPGMAPHIIDLPIWALGLGAPLITHSAGGRFVIQDDGDAPDTQEIIWQYPNLTMTWTMSCCNSFGFDFGRGKPDRRLGIYFHGANGTLFANYDKFEIVPEGDFLEQQTTPPESIPPSPGHEREWLDCIKSRREPSCSVNYHSNVSLAVTLGNLSYSLGRSVRFNPVSESLLDDGTTVKLPAPIYRDPWKFPESYLAGA